MMIMMTHNLQTDLKIAQSMINDVKCMLLAPDASHVFVCRVG